jgi:very-short-patch-repair endonuclease
MGKKLTGQALKNVRKANKSVRKRKALRKAMLGNTIWLGRKHSKETKKKMSEWQLGENNCQKRPEVRRKNSMAHKGVVVSGETRKKLSKAGKGRIVTKETRMKIAEKNKGQKRTKAQCKRISESQKGKTLSKETRKKMSKSMTKLCKEGKHLQHLLQISNMAKFGRKNKAEWRLHRMLMRLYPKMWLFTGNGRQRIGGKVPDFTHVRLKRVIELFGKHWHEESFTGKRNDNHVSGRKRHFKGYGYQTVIIWDSELKKGINYIYEKLVKGFKVKGVTV